jgi:hypothetical protein
VGRDGLSSSVEGQAGEGGSGESCARVAVVERGRAAAFAATGGGARRGGRRPVVVPRVRGGVGAPGVNLSGEARARTPGVGGARVRARHAESRAEELLQTIRTAVLRILLEST